MLLGSQGTHVEECVAEEEASLPFLLLSSSLGYTALDACNLRYLNPICAIQKCYIRCLGPRKKKIKNRILIAKIPQPRDFFLNDLNDSSFLVLKILFYPSSSSSDIKDGLFQFHGTLNIGFSVHPVWCLATRTN